VLEQAGIDLRLINRGDRFKIGAHISRLYKGARRSARSGRMRSWSPGTCTACCATGRECRASCRSTWGLCWSGAVRSSSRGRGADRRAGEPVGAGSAADYQGEPDPGAVWVVDVRLAALARGVITSLLARCASAPSLSGPLWCRATRPGRHPPGCTGR
jgi:hypothetical protein